MSDKYIKLKLEEKADGFVDYTVLETKNINIVEPGYVYEFYRPNTFTKNFEEGTWDGVNIHLVL